MGNRQNIYYWKCDRPSAFFALEKRDKSNELARMEVLLRPVLSDYFGSDNIVVRSAEGQGNHLIYIAEHNAIQRFIRLENGPEGDDFMEIEARILADVKALGIPSPTVFAADATRSTVSFAYQILEFIPYPDLNKLYKAGKLNLLPIAQKLGQYVAQWQTIKFKGYGPFDPLKLRKEGELRGLHQNYRDYFLLNWEKHLNFLVQNRLLTESDSDEIQELVKRFEAYLDIDEGCLVHKDLALWNILGDSEEIKAVVDWDDTVSGDPTDDFSLLACFHSGEVVAAALAGYEKVAPLPENFLTRFWLHLLRNMIVKAVIRVGANYFDRQSDFFLIGSASSGASLKTFTLERIKTACLGLQNQKQLKDL